MTKEKSSVMEEFSDGTECKNDVSATNTDVIATSSSGIDIIGEECVQLQSLYDKYKTQQKEIERLEEENSLYRDKLVKAMRERDLNAELLHSAQDAQKKETPELEKRIRDYEIQLKAVQDCAAAQEAHYNVTIKDLSLKYNSSVNQLTKKLEISEKERNDAVVKYATREAEIMRIRSENKKIEHELVECQKAKQALEQCQSQENVEHLEKINSNLRNEFEHAKQEKIDLDNRLKMAEKRVEAYNATVAELKQQCDVLRKQLIQIKDEKAQLQEENRQLSSKLQEIEMHRLSKDEDLNKFQSEMERQLIEANTNCAHLSESNREINSRLEEVMRENHDFLKKLQDLEDRLSLEEEAHASTMEKLSKFRDLESQIQNIQKRTERDKADKEQAENERKVAEKEAEECRLQTEKMLSITEQLAERNSQLSSELAASREHNCCMEQKLIKTETSLENALSKLSEKERDFEQMSGNGQSEIKLLRSELNNTLVKVQELTQRLQEERTDHLLTKKKYTATIKELKHELLNLRKQIEANPNSTLSVPSSTADSIPSTSSRSRASSVNSLDKITTLSRDENNTNSGQSISSESNTIQQAMIDKIISLQKKLARRNDKVEFLEEHVRCCLEELQKKTRIIQHYALREEASLLLPSNGSLEQVPLSRKGASYSLMGSIFSAGNEKRSLQLATEVNSKLQAVLEDVLIKNITLKGSVDSLSNEVSRLSRENRQLTLTHSRSCDQHS